MDNAFKVVEIDQIREKLIDICKQANDELRLRCGCSTWGDFADILIANGVTLDNQVSSSKWISVKDGFPDETKDEYVLVVCDYHGKIKVETRKMWHIDSVVTHWMPLPEPPKGE